MCTLNAQQIYSYTNPIHILQDVFYITEETEDAIEELLSEIRHISPINKCRDLDDYFIWFKTNRGTYDEFVKVFEGRYIYNGILDNEKMLDGWKKIFPDEEVWFGLKVYDYPKSKALFLNHKRFYARSNNTLPLRSGMYKNAESDMAPLMRYLVNEVKNVNVMLQEGIYMDYIENNLPLRYREGYITHKDFWKYCPEDFEYTFGKSNPEEIKEFLMWVDKYGMFMQKNKTYTTGEYFEACEKYYEIKGKITEEYRFMTPKELYARFSDGRDSNIMKIDENSPEEFEKWFSQRPDRHTWELDAQSNYLQVYKEQGTYDLCLTYYNSGTEGVLIGDILKLVRAGVPMGSRHYTKLAQKFLGNQEIQILSPIFESSAWTNYQ